jgi:hypothetical protein
MTEYFESFRLWIGSDKNLFTIYFITFILMSGFAVAFFLKKVTASVYREPLKQDEMHDLISQRADSKMKKFYESFFTILFLATLANERWSAPEDVGFNLTMGIYVAYQIFVLSFLAEKFYKRQALEKLVSEN